MNPAEVCLTSGWWHVCPVVKEENKIKQCDRDPGVISLNIPLQRDGVVTVLISYLPSGFIVFKC